MARKAYRNSVVFSSIRPKRGTFACENHADARETVQDHLDIRPHPPHPEKRDTYCRLRAALSLVWSQVHWLLEVAHCEQVGSTPSHLIFLRLRATRQRTSMSDQDRGLGRRAKEGRGGREGGPEDMEGSDDPGHGTHLQDSQARQTRLR